MYADDDTTPLAQLLKMRLPSLGVGLGLGILLSFITSKFETVLLENIRLAFFIPFIVYMADAVGTQTQSIYVRDLKSGKAVFHHYLVKETALGLVIGLLAGAAVAGVVWLWFQSAELVLTVSLAMFSAVAIAPVVALVVAEIFQLEHTDPAVGGGPIATVVQDTLTMLVYGLIATAIILH